MKPLLESEAGIGRLQTLGGDAILNPAEYSITVEHAQIAGGLPLIRGQILNVPDGGLPAAIVGREVLLHLEDGREWDCRLADARGLLEPRGEKIRQRA
jgi:hypothetical protein